jgi:cysteine-rich repeat protein
MGSCGGEGPEAVYEIDLAETTSIHLDTVGSRFDTVLYVREGGCETGTEIHCCDDCGGYLASRADLFSLPAGLYSVFVDGFGDDDSGELVLTYDAAPPGCGNGLLEPGEGCDDGNTADGDACSSTCAPLGAYALLFDGGVDDAAVLDAPELSLREDFTVELWFRVDAPVGGDRRLLLRKGSRAPNYYLWVDDSGALYGGVGLAWGTTVTANAGVSVDDGLWHHAALTYDGTTVALHLDGALADSDGSGSGPASTNDGPLMMGRAHIIDPGPALEGALDEVRLSSTVRYGAAGFVPERHMVVDPDTRALWHFDEGSGLGARDAAADLYAMLNGCTWELE